MNILMKTLMLCATMVALMLCFASCKEKAPEKNCIVDGYECVDMGLSVKWATYNVGASCSEEVGDYFAWGEVSPKEKYSDENSITYGDTAIGNIAGNSQYDAATANWGGSWRMPTEEELRELKNKCRTKWVTRNGVEGCLFISKKNGNSLFLPAAGKRCRYEELDEAFKGKHEGYYWSASPNISDSTGRRSWCFHFDTCSEIYGIAFNCGDYGIYVYSDDFGIRDEGFCVRPVTE